MFLARLTGWFSGMLALLTVFLLVFLVMLFPDGRLPSRRWRSLLWAMLLVVAGGVAAQLQEGTTFAVPYLQRGSAETTCCAGTLIARGGAAGC